MYEMLSLDPWAKQPLEILFPEDPCGKPYRAVLQGCRPPPPHMTVRIQPVSYLRLFITGDDEDEGKVH
jgi:hypothetical protein